jgi:hypothetical protein
MNEKDSEPEKIEQEPVDENMGFFFSSAIKIHDPNTSEVLVQIRGDN